MPLQGMLPHPAQIRPRKRFSHLRGDLPCCLQLFFGDMGALHHAQDEGFHIHHRGHEQGLFRLFCPQCLHNQPCPDADPIEPDMRPDRLHPGIDCLNFRHHRPRQQLFRAVPARSVFGQVDGQHLPACCAGGVCKALSLFLAAIFPVDIKIHLAAALAVQDGRNARKGKILFFHKGFSFRVDAHG